MDILQWLQEWFKAQCNGSWEHMSGIRISTLDNPGWDIKIELENTDLEGLELKLQMISKNNDDWYGIKVEGNLFEGFGDPTKLGFLLLKFKEIVENHSSSLDDIASP